MSILTKGIDVILHIDKYLGILLSIAGDWTYLLLFLIIFVETGLVFVPFLPGDSLLFTAGAFASQGYFNLPFLLVLLISAAIIGDSVNYWIGLHLGDALVRKNLVKKEHLEKTKTFYDRYGKKTIFFARFVPIIRTFAPFVAGIGKMEYPVFLTYNFLGGITWVTLFILGGYFFGTLPFVQEHFSLFVISIIILSFVPMLYEVVRASMKKNPEDALH